MHTERGDSCALKKRTTERQLPDPAPRRVFHFRRWSPYDRAASPKPRTVRPVGFLHIWRMQSWERSNPKREHMTPYRLHNGDCLEVMREFPDDSVDMVLADIPYGEVNRESAGLRNLDKGKADEVTFQLGDVVDECLRICSGTAYIFCGTEQVSEIRAAFVRAGLSTRLGVWEKTNPSPMNGQHMWLSSVECCVYGKRRGAVFNEHCKSSVWRHPIARGKLHPTMKPVGLMERLILASSHEGETVLDFTMGSGTTGVACMRTGRKFIGIEKDPEYFQIAENRIRDSIDLLATA